ncbi:MAG: hypothetical protein CM15mP120_09230 [Pseudomonadota bacterium]|nr:MAG: hypothetical protein CM15mP120_09230 [Pseudomonadota bacterium]
MTVPNDPPFDHFGGPRGARRTYWGFFPPTNTTLRALPFWLGLFSGSAPRDGKRNGLEKCHWHGAPLTGAMSGQTRKHKKNEQYWDSASSGSRHPYPSRQSDLSHFWMRRPISPCVLVSSNQKGSEGSLLITEKPRNSRGTWLGPQAGSLLRCVLKKTV